MTHEADILSVKDAAAYLKVAERTIYKMASEGTIPAVKVGGQWRFRRAWLDEWLEAQRRPVPLTPAAMDATAHPPTLSTATFRAILGLKSDSVVGLIEELGHLAEDMDVVRDATALVDAVKERERVSSTAVGYGVAFPHPRWPEGLQLEGPVVLIARSPDTLPIPPPDGEPVRLICLVAAPTSAAQLQLMAELARRLRDPARRKRIFRATDADEVIAAVRDGHA